MTDTTDILVTVRPAHVQRYESALSAYKDFGVRIVPSIQNALEILANEDIHIDVLVADNLLDNIHELVTEVRTKYPRLLIVLVDEEADFAIPGMADDISTEPFVQDDLARRIDHLMSERRQATLRSDSLPAVRGFAKHLRSAVGLIGKQQAAVEACLETGYDYVAYYGLDAGDYTRITLKAQSGPAAIKSIAPKQASPDDLMTWVTKNGQSRIAGPEDRPNHPLVARGRLGAVACVPVSHQDQNFGALVACRDRPDSITQDNVMMLELISAQLAASIAKEANS